MPHSDGFPRGQSRRITQLTGNTTILTNGLITFVGQDGVNYKIAFDDFLNTIGTTGSLTQEGSVLGTPVLDGILTDFKIRNLEDGPGVKSSVSPENGITIEHNFQPAAGGAQIFIDVTEASPIFRSLVSDGTIDITSIGDTLQLGVSGATPISTKTIQVNVEADFGTAVGTTYNLLPDTQYFLTNDITTANNFVFADNTVMSSAGSSLITLTYTGTDDMLILGSGSSNVTQISLTCPSATCVKINGGGTAIAGLRNCRIIADKIAEIDSPSIFVCRSMLFNATSGGVTFSGNAGSSIFDGFLSNIASGAVFDLGAAVFSGFSIENCVDLSPPGTVFLSGLAGSGNIEPGKSGSVSGCNFENGVTPFSGLDEDDARWTYLLNSQIRNTRRDAIISTQANATPTTFGAAGVPTKVLATWTTQRLSGYTADAAGTITQAIGKGAVTPITIAISAQANAGGNPTYRFYVTVNGTPVVASSVGIQLSNAAPTSITLVWQEVLADGDTIELFIENETNTTSATIIDSVVRVD